jgi:hypothetical protein
LIDTIRIDANVVDGIINRAAPVLTDVKT